MVLRAIRVILNGRDGVPISSTIDGLLVDQQSVLLMLVHFDRVALSNFPLASAPLQQSLEIPLTFQLGMDDLSHLISKSVKSDGISVSLTLSLASLL